MIRTAQSCLAEAADAVEAFHRDIMHPDLALVVFFCSSDFALDRMAAELARRFGEIPVIGCTAAGAFGPKGFHQHTISGIGFCAPWCLAEVCHLPLLPSFDAEDCQQQVHGMRERLAAKGYWVQSTNTFALQLIDGLSIKEEAVSRTVQNALGATFMVGGSAGDDLAFRQTHVYHDGAFHSGEMVLALVATQLPFHLFMTQHFHVLPERMVVTKADEAQRIVYEINGLPAAKEYARCAGVVEDERLPELFSKTPVVVKVGDRHYVRAIQQTLPGGALKFYCAIEEGMVLHLAQGGDMVRNLSDAFDEVESALGGPPVAIFGSDCILRRLEIQQRHLDERMNTLYTDHNMVGFATYGEQLRGVHINQTLTGVAFGQLPEKAS
ncbi:MAG: FIST C-terminal domain-containing protein [Paludibacterium sp.]|uniref:FIST N-terminal domain-containing protein n=1 Tax=Paludibacterium sp. TaxID=1917523 RepID=UPI0025FFA41D|nr:FIST N-terminal domain-containing protein [Paludibacterium sp.]MBV8047779.1 FIST C-terminal domain-containing protein [Paludibacterium sp.]MBV8648771.1 FIST C-terminal domain-containing protein [Paludibacterium sp.]